MTPVRDDIRLLSIFHYVLAGLSSLCACFPLVYVGLGAAFTAGAFAEEPHPPPAALGFVFMGLGGVILLLLVGWIVALIVAGRSIARQRNWTFCVVVAGVSCASCHDPDKVWAEVRAQTVPFVVMAPVAAVALNLYGYSLFTWKPF